MKLLALSCAGLTLLVSSAAALNWLDDKPGHSIKEIMKLVNKGNQAIAPKVVGGKGSAEDKQQLVALYEDLAKNTPPKGSEDSWKEKTAAALKAAQDIAAGKPGAEAAFRKANNCKACHDVHQKKG